MLTTPARSDHRPPRPASMMGVVATMVAAIAPDDARSLAPVTSSSTASSRSTAGSAATKTHRGVRRVLGGAAGGTPVAVAGTLMLFLRGPRGSVSPPREALPASSFVGWSCQRLLTVGPLLFKGPSYRLLLQADAGAAHHLVGDDDREDDHALGDGDDVRRDPHQDLQRVGLLVEEGEEQRTDRDPDRVVAAEQGDGDAGEAEPGLERRAVVVAVTEEDREPDQAGHGARDQHREDDHPGDLDAAR